jgi:hypothetical protein
MKLTRKKINYIVCIILFVVTFLASGQVSAQPDLIVSELSVTSYAANYIYYSYTIKNVGDVPAILEGPTGVSNDNVGVQAYLSADQIFHNAGDIAAGGRVLSMSPVAPLDPGETFSGSFSCTTTVNPQTHPYLVLMVDYSDVVVESEETNNTLATLLDVPPEPDIEVSHLIYDFNMVDLNTTLSYELAIGNIGSANLTINSISLQEGSGEDYSISYESILPVSLGAFESIDVEVAYTPSTLGISSGVIDIVSDDSDEPLVEVSLYGIGVLIDEKDTPAGEHVIVELMHKKKAKKKVTVKYEKVLEEGITKMVIKKPEPEEPLPENHKLGNPAELLELETTAKIEGEITVYIDYSDTLYEGSENKLKMYHKAEAEEWKDITLIVETLKKEVVGKTNSFSDFGIFELDALGLINGLINDVLMLNLQQGISNSLDAKLSAALQAVDDFNACNDIAAINTFEAFIAAVAAQRGNKIPEDDADELIAAALEIIALLSSE